MKTQWLYKVSSAFLIVMLAIAALPVTTAMAAVTNWYSPTTVQFTEWVNATDAFSSNDIRASEASDGDEVIYNGFGITIPPGNVIYGIEVSLEGYTNNSRDVDVELSWTDTGNNWTNNEFVNFTNNSSSDETFIVGGPTDTWGENWSLAEIGVLRVRIINDNDNGTFFLDHVQVRVYYDLPPEINVQGNATTINDGDNTPSTADWTDFGNVGQGVPVDRTYTIQNTGTGDLLIGAITFTGGENGDFSVVSAPAATVAPGGSTTFTVRLTAGGGGGPGSTIRNTTINIANNDSNEALYNFDVQGTRVTTTSEINVQGNATTIVDGDNTPNVVDCTNFGSVALGGSVDCTYTIQNLGTNDLFVGPVTLGGANAADFSVIASPGSFVTAANSTTFTVRFTPSALGARNATVSFANNDAGENPYNWNIQGTGINLVTPTLSITNSPVVYNGSQQTATVTCSSGGAVSNILYGGSPTAPTNVGTYAVTANCAAMPGYTSLTNASAGNFVINPATPTASVTNSPVTYTGAVQTATVACSGGGTATLVSGTGTGTNAGSYPATVDCAASANYIAATGLAAGNFVINPATPTASVTNSPVTYTGAVQTATVACSGGGTATLVSGTGTGTNAGSYPATVDCAASANYIAATGLAAGNFVINPATPTASVTNSPVTYTGAVQTATVACSGGGTATLVSGTGTGTNAGSYPATVDCAASANYIAATGLAAGNFVINPATPTASVTNSPVTYTGAVQTATVACSGGGTATLVSGTGTGTNAGSYPATVDCAASANYIAATGLAAGNFVINPATPTASVTNSPVTYTGAVQTATVACSGGGTATLVSGTGTGTNAGSYPATVDCAASANYIAATGLAAGNFVINPANTSLTVTNGPVDYDGSPHAATVSCLGGGTASNILTGGAATQTNAGTYAVTADCAASVNYAAAVGITAVNNFVINQIAPTATVTNTPQDYTGAPQSATVSCLGGGAASNILTGGAATQTNAGSYAVTTDCAASTNYTAASGIAAGNFVINPIAPTATVTNSPQIYTGSPLSAAVACSGGGVVSNILTGGAATQTNTGTYPVTADCAASANYVAGTGISAGDFVIGVATQTITVTTNAPATASNGSTFSVAATATSGLTVSITASGVCTIVDNGNGTADITMTSGTGTCSVFYDQAGDGNYSAASQVQEDVTATEGPAFTSANNTTFDVTFFGTFTITAVGNPQTMTISLVGSLPSGVTFTDNGDGTAVLSGTPALGTNGTYPLSLTANNGVNPNGTQPFTLTVKNGPIIGANGVNSIPDTGNGSISENELILDTLGITQLTVEFSQDVYNPAGDTDPDDVTNPANYILVRSTSSSFATVSCSGNVIAPDVAISVDSVTYSNGGGAGPYVSTLFINGGLPINVVGFYRLYVCGTTSIVDANNTGLILAGNGTTPGTDFQRNFRISTTSTGGGGGGGGGSTSSTTVNGSFLIPVTGFAPDHVMALPAQPADKQYASMGQMTIEIPTLGVKFPIVGASINNKTWDLTWLQDSVAYLEGSAYPTTAGNTVLTAHVQDANKNLGPFSDIKGMELGQKIYIHVNGQTYVYQVQESRKISPISITTMFKHEEDSWITLVTCEDYNAKTGLYSTRRMVRAVLISVIPSKK
jgi:LPXTG-site transpeptidase (sortase) family protein